MNPQIPRRIPQLDPLGRDPLTGGVCPPGGSRRQVQFEPLRFGHGERLTSHCKSAEEIADMWQPGDSDCGISPAPADGRILPRIDHVAWQHPLTDITGAALDDTDIQIEHERRSWYAARMSCAPRLTPVQHILGPSEPAWRGAMTWRDIEQRDAWRARLWEPERLKVLLDTIEGIYRIDWGRLPEDKILAPIATQHRRAERGGLATEPGLRLKVQRARADLDTIRRIALAVVEGQMEEASQAHAQLAANADSYDRESAALRGIGVGTEVPTRPKGSRKKG